MNIDTAIREARQRIHASVDASADRAIQEIHFITSMYREAIMRKAAYHNRSAGQLKRWQNERR